MITLTDVQAALTLPQFDPIQAQIQMAPQMRPMQREGRAGQPRQAAVLVLFYPRSADNSLHFVLTQRNEYEGVHSGQVSLPGGRLEQGETVEQAALRETCEELGMCDPVEILGQLAPLYVPPSDFEIHPVVAAATTAPAWQPDPREVAAVIEVPVTDLLDDSKKAVGTWELRSGITSLVPHYVFGGRVVWGATAVMLSELEGRLRAVSGANQNL
jgi:8-oxo-dGTP pyrophosphatase MutT (NUDIX family)